MNWKYGFISYIIVHELWDHVIQYVYDVEMELCPKSIWLWEYDDLIC